MLQCVVFGVILIVADVSMSTVHQHDNALDLNDRDFITALIDKQRVKRATLTSMLASVLKGASRVSAKGESRLYIKPGGYQQALADFHAFKPRKTLEFKPDTRWGFSASKTILLTQKDGTWKLKIRHKKEYHANAEARTRRALPSILEALFDGARLIMKSGDYELFGKTGGYSQAKAEFELLGLKSVRTNSVGYGRAATVGDRTVILSRNGKGGTIDVWKNKLSPDGTRTPYRIKRIRYMD